MYIRAWVAYNIQLHAAVGNDFRKEAMRLPDPSLLAWLVILSQLTAALANESGKFIKCFETYNSILENMTEFP